MSKQSVGDVYAKVINDVCDASRVDFEEGGVELSTLDLLKSEWQKKLSGLKIAHLPWDPTPAPPAKEQSTSNNAKSAAAAAAAAQAQAATLPSNGHTASPVSAQSTSGVPIKQDPQPYNPQQPLPNYAAPQLPQNRMPTAQERAAMALHQKFGNQAGTQIAQLQQQNHGRVPMPVQYQQQQQQQQQQQSGPFIKREDSASDPVNYKPDMNHLPIKTSQTDGSNEEYESEIARRRALIAKHRGAGDRLMRAHLMASQQELEGGGLLMPLDERRDPIILNPRPVRGSSLARAQGDAADDEEDEDAINSDLDDPDELDNPQNEEAEIQEVMLCTYDKVQRVKNKWKCTLKDGILRVEGAEYVFHKGQGEFEW